MKLKKKVCVLYGGSSDEREVSIRSGTAILNALKNNGINAYGLDASNGFRSHLKTNPPDVVFIAVHGRGGEDGLVQRHLERLQIPYVGSNSKASRVTFDKIKAKKVFQDFGILTPAWVVVTKQNLRTVAKSIQLPAVIKPICNGSSIGISMVGKRREMLPQLKSAVTRYGHILVEKKIVGREFTVGILGARALPVIELKPKRSFYDYQAKYTKGLTEYLVPAPINQKLSKRIQRIAQDAHRVLGLRDFSRVDLMMDRDENIFVLEANSIPGFTETSLLPKAAQAAGIDFKGLCRQLLSCATKRMRKT